jgi:hypothetical protein
VLDNIFFENREAYKIIWKIMVKPLQGTDYNTIEPMRWHAGFLMLQTDTQNMQLLLIFYGNNG